jgi:hypothetical protein
MIEQVEAGFEFLSSVGDLSQQDFKKIFGGEEWEHFFNKYGYCEGKAVRFLNCLDSNNKGLLIHYFNKKKDVNDDVSLGVAFFRWIQFSMSLDIIEEIFGEEESKDVWDGAWLQGEDAVKFFQNLTDDERQRLIKYFLTHAHSNEF